MSTRILTIGALLALAACANPLAPLGPTQESILREGIVTIREPVAPPPVYCYRTLARPDCYRRAGPGEIERLIGSYGPIPD